MAGTVCTVMLMGAPGEAAVKATVAGWGRRKPITPHTAKPMTTTRRPRTTVSLPPNDMSYSSAMLAIQRQLCDPVDSPTVPGQRSTFCHISVRQC